MAGGGDESTVKTEPWAPMQPYIAQAVGDAQQRYNAAKAYPNYPTFSTVEPFNLVQEQGQQMALDYADVALPNLISNVGESYQNLLNPGNNPVYQNTMGTQGAYQQYLQDVMGRGLPDVENIAQNIANSVGSNVTMGQMYGGVGNFADPIVRNVNFNAPPVVALDQPQIQFNRGVAENETLTDTLNQMMSGEVNMDIWQPLMDQMSRSMTRDFTEQVMPHVRSEAMAAGAYGQSMGMRGTGLASDRFSENLADSMERIIAQGGIQALQQQQAGAGLAAQMYGQDLDAELRRALAQGQLGMDTLRLREAQRASLAGEDIARNELAINRDLGLSGLNLQRDTARENAAIQRSQLGFEAQRWQDQLNRDMALAGLDAGMRRYTADLNAGLQAGSILSNEVQNMYNQGLGAQLGALGEAGRIAELGGLPAEIYNNVGNLRYDLAQRQRADEVDRFWAEHPVLGTEGANQTWYQNAIAPYLSAGAQQTTPYESSNPLMGALGGGALGAGIYGALPAAAASGPVGWGLIGGGALLGGLASL